MVLNPQGEAVPLSGIASFEVVPGQTERHRDRLRPFVAVTARIEGRALGSTVMVIGIVADNGSSPGPRPNIRARAGRMTGWLRKSIMTCAPARGRTISTSDLTRFHV